MRMTLCLEKEWLLNFFIIFSTNCIYFKGPYLDKKKEKEQLIFMN